MNIAVILAGGVGSRFGADKPKQYFLLNKKPILFHTINSFVKSGLCDKYIIVMSKPYFKLGENLIQDNFDNPQDFTICEGGETRQHSLFNGVVKAIELYGENSTIISHCAARPVVPKDVIAENIAQLKPGRVVNTVRHIYDTMLYTNDQNVTEFIDRNRTYVGLTPQTFYAKDYITAFKKVESDVSKFTCACSLMTAAGFPMDLYATDAAIHKITLRSDINIIKQHLKELNQ